MKGESRLRFQASGILAEGSRHVSDSGIGRENGLEAYRSYSQSKSVIMNTASEEITRANDDWFAEQAEDVRYG
jgi:hypothetical protein